MEESEISQILQRRATKRAKRRSIVTKLGSVPRPLFPTSSKNIAAEDLIELRKKGLSYNEIAKVVGCSEQNVVTRFKRLAPELRDAGDFRQHRADILTMQQKRVIDAISPTDLKKAGLRDKVVAFGVLYDKEKIETGKGPEGGIKIEIINYAGASQTGEGKVTQAIMVKPGAMAATEPDEVMDDSSV